MRTIGPTEIHFNSI